MNIDIKNREIKRKAQRGLWASPVLLVAYPFRLLTHKFFFVSIVGNRMIRYLRFKANMKKTNII